MRVVLALALAMLPAPALAFCTALGTSNEAFWQCINDEQEAKAHEEALRQEMGQRLERLEREQDEAQQRQRWREMEAEDQRERLESLESERAARELERNWEREEQRFRQKPETAAISTNENVDNIEQSDRRALSTSIIQNSPHLAAYLRSNPLASVVSNDDDDDSWNFVQAIQNHDWFDFAIGALFSILAIASALWIKRLRLRRGNQMPLD